MYEKLCWYSVFIRVFTHTQYIKQEFTGYTEDKQAHSVVFDDDEIQLDIPLDPPVVVDGWRIVPLTYPRVFMLLVIK